MPHIPSIHTIVDEGDVKRMLDTQQIKEIIPHRYPFLLVDRITEVEEGKRAAGYKNVTANEDFSTTIFLNTLLCRAY